MSNGNGHKPNMMNSFVGVDMKAWFSINDGVILVFEENRGLKIVPYRASDGRSMISYEEVDGLTMRKLLSHAKSVLAETDFHLAKADEVLS